jgi:MFS family permease
VVSLRVRANTAAAQLTPPIRRVLAHSLLLGLAMSIADLLFNFYLVSLGYSTGSAGFFSTVYRFAGVIAGLPIGLMIDRLGAQRTIMIGAALFGVGWAIQLMQTALWALMLTQALIGASGLLALTAVVPLLTGITTPEQRASMFGLNAAAALVIGLLGGTVGGVLPSIAASLIDVGPQTTLAYRIALGAVVMLAFCAILPVAGKIELLAGERERPAKADGETPRLSPIWLLRVALPALSLGVGAGAFLPFQNLFFREQFHLPDSIVGAIIACGGLSMGIGAMMGSQFARRIGVKQASALMRAICAPAMLLMLIPVLPVVIIGYFIRGWGIGASYPLSDAYTMEITDPRHRGTTVSIVSVAWSLGWAATSSVAGWTEERYGFAPLLVVGIIAYVLSALSIMKLPSES